MAGFYTHGPTLTYVTDPALSLPEQQRVLTGFCRCAGDQMLRVAFRLPDSSSDDVTALLEWYLRVADVEGVREYLLPPLIHGHALIVKNYPETQLWLPARYLENGTTAAAYSVHDLAEAQRAIAAGAEEIIFGHVFASVSHPGEPGRGLDALNAITAIRTDVNAPAVTAIGGVDEHTIGDIGRARVFNVACIRAISRSPDIANTLVAMRGRWLMAIIDEDMNDPDPSAFRRHHGIFNCREFDRRSFRDQVAGEKP